MNKPLVSIIINCRNGEKYLKKCIDSILSQNYSNWEIIFWDNNSSDNSSYIFHSYKDKRLNYFFSKNSDTLYAARNKAVEKANGKYIGFLDVDDMWLENNLSKKVEFLEKNNNYKIVYSNYYILNEIKNKNSIFFNFELPSGYITYRLLKKYSIGILSVLIDRDIFLDNKFNEEYNIVGDFDFFLEISMKFKIGVIQEPLANYRLHNSNYSKKNIQNHILELQNWLRKNKSKFKKNKYNLVNIKINILKLKFKNLLVKLFNIRN